MHLVDTHAHLNDERYDQDVAEVISRAEEAGVGRIVVCGYDIPSSRKAVQLAKEHESVVATVGIHPHDGASLDDSALNLLAELAKQPKVVAIGEIGMDFHYTFCPRDVQAEAFEAQVLLAGELNLPIVIHSRDSVAETTNILSTRAKKIVGGVFHCYAGDQELLQKVLALGMYIGIDGPITFKNCHKLIRVLYSCPTNRLLLETDSPYLAPEPFRGKRNEPAYLPIIAQRVADIMEYSVEYIATQTTINARALFGDAI